MTPPPGGARVLVVLGSAVDMKRWRHDARKLLHEHRRELSRWAAGIAAQLAPA